MRDRELVKLYQLHISVIVLVLVLVLATNLGCSTLPPSEQAAWRRWNPELGVQQQGTVIGEGAGVKDPGGWKKQYIVRSKYKDVNGWDQQ